MKQNISISGQSLDVSALKTPHLLYVEKDLAYNLEMLRSHVGANIFFALKSCYCRAVLNFFSESGIGAEVMSEFEFDLAKSCGFSGERIIVNGLGRSAQFLEKAATSEAVIIIDSEEDLVRLQQIAKSVKDIRLGFRISPTLPQGAETPYSKKNKLGSAESDSLFEKFFIFIENNPSCHFEILHMHFAINCKNSSLYESGIKEICGILERMQKRWPDVKPRFIDIGGGFYPFSRNEEEEAARFFSKINNLIKQYLSTYEVIIEPGRILVNSAGYAVTSVMDYKQSRGVNYLYVDAGTNVLIPIPSAHYSLAEPAGSEQDEGVFTTTICDGITSPDNIIIKNVTLKQKPKTGDRLVIANTGAYTDVLGEFWVYEPYEVSFISVNGEIINVRHREDIVKARALMWGI